MTARKDVKKENRWNLEALFPSIAAWKKELNTLTSRKEAPFFPDLLKLKGSLKDEKKIKKALTLFFSISRKLEKLYVYAHHYHDTDTKEQKGKEIYAISSSLYHAFLTESAWLKTELLKVKKTTLHHKILAPYRFYLDSLTRIKPHTLPLEQEELLARAGKACSTPHKAFSALSDADFSFDSVLDSKKKKHPLSHARYSLNMKNKDRTLRKNTFSTYFGKYEQYENTFSEILSGQIESHIFNAKAKKYDSSLEAALFPRNIDVEVYKNLISSVHEKISALHDYISLRKKAMKVDKLHYWDLYTPLIEPSKMHFSYEEAEDLLLDAVEPLGKDYQKLLRQGLKKDRWADRYENENKRSGAYSGGCYDSYPYILMNFNGTLRDVFTLAHEAGHSMHSLLARKKQPYQYGDYDLFVAEIASTFNEDLLMKALIKKTKSKKEKAFLLTEKLEDIRATLFRQTMFAEFELLIHTAAEQNIPLTPQFLKEEYLKLNTFYFGKELTYDPLLSIEWARIPHFYYNFYVFQYATGISAALLFSKMVREGGNKERERYLHLLQSGGSNYPLQLLEEAGVNMREKSAVNAAIDTFSYYTKELDSLLF